MAASDSLYVGFLVEDIMFSLSWCIKSWGRICHGPAISPHKNAKAINNMKNHLLLKIEDSLNIYLFKIKTSQRIILELKDKVLLLEGSEQEQLVLNTESTEAASALEVLGYSQKQTSKIFN